MKEFQNEFICLSSFTGSLDMCFLKFLKKQDYVR